MLDSGWLIAGASLTVSSLSRQSGADLKGKWINGVRKPWSTGHLRAPLEIL